MSQVIATLICFLGIGYLFLTDRRRPEGVSAAIWIPVLWMLFAGSRFPSQWLSLGAPEGMTAAAYDEGSPLDRNVFLMLIVIGIWVLGRRRDMLVEIIYRNRWVVLFFAFALMSVLWSDEPFVSFKRWVKGCGNVIVALILVTEKRPYEALGYVMRRLAYVLLPLSVLFIKYYPELGRSYHMGTPMFTGVAFQKNSLGQLCMILSIYFCWQLILGRRRPTPIRDPSSTFVQVIIFSMLVWLLYMAQSATALAIVVASLAFYLTARMPIFADSPPRLATTGIAACGLYILLESLFNVKDAAIRMLGRDPDLTDRKPLWSMLLQMSENPWVGTGYESFWSGERLVAIWSRMGDTTGGVTQAHSGYIDLYLNLGIIGLVILGIAVLRGLINAKKGLDNEYAHAVLALVFIFAALAYNYTEAAFKPLNNVFTLMLFALFVMRKHASQAIHAAQQKIH
jgi:O-antigen ligase